MRSQFILIFTLLLLLGLLYFVYNVEAIPSYKYNLDKYFIEDFKVKLLLYNKTIVNSTYYELCKEYGVICYYNGTHIIYKKGYKTIVVKV